MQQSNRSAGQQHGATATWPGVLRTRSDLSVTWHHPPELAHNRASRRSYLHAGVNHSPTLFNMARCRYRGLCCTQSCAPTPYLRLGVPRLRRRLSYHGPSWPHVIPRSSAPLLLAVSSTSVTTNVTNRCGSPCLWRPPQPRSAAAARLSRTAPSWPPHAGASRRTAG